VIRGRWARRWARYHRLLDAIDDLRWEIHLRERRAMSAGRLPLADPPGSVPPLRPEHYAHLEYGGPGEWPPADSSPIVDLRGLVKQSLTKKSRADLGQHMIEMCTLTGWQGTTLNPDMADSDKLAILTARFGKLVTQDDAAQLYTELIDISAASMGWAQGIARREKREHRRELRAKKKARKAAEKKDRKG
jgi:hypothetical protein